MVQSMQKSIGTPFQRDIFGTFPKVSIEHAVLDKMITADDDQEGSSTKTDYFHQVARNSFGEFCKKLARWPLFSVRQAIILNLWKIIEKHNRNYLPN